MQQKDVPASIYKALLEAFEECGGNVTAIERYLRDRGISTSRSTLAKMMDHLGLPRIKKPRE